MKTQPVLTRQMLCEQFCEERKGADALSKDALSAQLLELPGWTHSHDQDGAIERDYAFEDYFQTMAFINALAYVVHREDHHPDITFGYNQARVRFSTHSAKGITLNDFICAAKADALYHARMAAH